MKIIFLDIDGVLNEARSRSRSPSGFLGIDNNKVKRLKRIVDETGARIVLSSTWRRDWNGGPVNDLPPDTQYMIKKLARYNLKVMDRTGEYEWHQRGAEILQWLLNHEGCVEQFVILDDELFPDFEKCGLLPHFVQTNFLDGGLRDRYADQAITVLNGEGGLSGDI